MGRIEVFLWPGEERVYFPRIALTERGNVEIGWEMKNLSKPENEEESEAPAEGNQKCYLAYPILSIGRRFSPTFT